MDAINPSHYQGFSNGAQVIDITENLNYNRGNAVKYVARAGEKDSSKEVEDLEKAKWYLAREIDRITRPASEPTMVIDVDGGVLFAVSGVKGSFYWLGSTLYRAGSSTAITDFEDEGFSVGDTAVIL